MTLQLTMLRRGDNLVPAAEIFLEDMRAIPEGREVVVTVKRSRSPKHLRFFFAKLRAIITAGHWDGDTDSLLSYLKIGVGHCVTVIDNASTMVGGATLALAEQVLDRHGRASDEGKLARALIELAGPKTYLVPKSIDFDSLGQDAFNDFDQRVDRFIHERMGIDPQLLRQRSTEGARGPGDDLPSATENSSVADPGPAGTQADLPLDMRFAQLALEIGKSDSLPAFETLWAEAKQRAEVKALHQRAPETLKAIVEAGRSKAWGKLDEERFRNVVNLAIDQALKESVAA